MATLNNGVARLIALIQRHESVVRFLFVGSLNTFIDLVLFTIFANFIGITPVVASIMSTGITLCFSFFMNSYFVFRSSRKKRQTVLLFVIITLVNVWGVQSLIIATVLGLFGDVTFFQEHIWTFNVFAKVCGISVSLVLNYLGYRTIFKNIPKKEQNDKE